MVNFFMLFLISRAQWCKCAMGCSVGPKFCESCKWSGELIDHSVDVA